MDMILWMLRRFIWIIHNEWTVSTPQTKNTENDAGKKSVSMEKHELQNNKRATKRLLARNQQETIPLLFSLTVQGICQNISMWEDNMRDTHINEQTYQIKLWHIHRRSHQSNTFKSAHHEVKWLLFEWRAQLETYFWNRVQEFHFLSFKPEKIIPHLYVPVWQLYFLPRIVDWVLCSVFCVCVCVRRFASFYHFHTVCPSHPNSASRVFLFQYYYRSSVNLSIHI